MKSIPSISRLDYLDVVLTAACRTEDGPTLNEVRIAIGQHVDDLALRGEAHRTRDWRHPMAYYDTAVSCVRELMRWGMIEDAPLADSASRFERIRHQRVRLTPEGRRMTGLGAAERRDLFGRRMLARYDLFRDLMELLSAHDLLVPELSDTQVKDAFSVPLRPAEDQDGWGRLAAVATDALGRKRPAGGRPPAETPPRDQLALELGRHLRRRFRTRTPENLKEVTGAVNKAIAQGVLRAAGFDGDWNAYDRCLRWGRDLYLCNDARHVVGSTGWMAWSASKVAWDGSGFRIERRGVARHREDVQEALTQAYADIAAARKTGSVQVPLVPIYEVRETAAFRARVCDEVVDNVLGDMAFSRSGHSLVIRLHLADLKDFVPSARPFRINGRRYFYISMHPPEQEKSQALLEGPEI